MTTAANLLTDSRLRLQLSDPFLGAASLYLDIVERPAEWFLARAPWTAPTAATDGLRVYYYRPFIESLTPRQRDFVLGHEALHVIRLDPMRRGSRNPAKWNMAADYAMHADLLRNGKQEMERLRWEMVNGVLYDPQFHGMAAEQIYPLLPDPPQAPGGAGIVLDPQDADGKALDEDAQRGLEREWTSRCVEIAEAMRQAGTLGPGYERFVRELLEPKIPWGEVLRRWVREMAGNPTEDQCWKPNRRWIWRGMVMPSRLREGIGLLDVYVDLSGSISQKEMDAFLAEIEGVRMDVAPETTRVVFFDHGVRRVAELGVDERLDVDGIEAGGGTMMAPVLDWVRESGRFPAVGVWLTDLGFADRPGEPEWPMVFASTHGEKWDWGRVVRLELEG